MSTEGGPTYRGGIIDNIRDRLEKGITKREFEELKKRWIEQLDGLISRAEKVYQATTSRAQRGLHEACGYLIDELEEMRQIVRETTLSEITRDDLDEAESALTKAEAAVLSLEERARLA